MTSSGSNVSDAPMSQWGDALRREKSKRRSLGRRAAWAGGGLAVLGATIIAPPTPRVVWNSSASAPVGLYWVMPEAPVDIGDMVIARVPERYRDIAGRRGYLPSGVPLVKRVAGVAGDDICARGPIIFINGRQLAERREGDAMGRPLPNRQGCFRLRGRQLFLLMEGNRASFDGRYFGATEGTDVLGKARPLWTWTPPKTAPHH